MNSENWLQCLKKTLALTLSVVMQTTSNSIYQKSNTINLNPPSNVLVLAFRGICFCFINVRDLGAPQSHTLHVFCVKAQLPDSFMKTVV